MAALVEEEATTALTGNFTFVFIPGDNYSPPQEVVKSLSGGLENDELQIFAKQHFSGVKLGEDTYMASVMNQLKAQGQDLSTLDPALIESLKQSNSGTIEIISLEMPTSKNGYIGVSMYCDSNGVAKCLQPNTRATAIARACGHKEMVVLGDAFLGRTYDNEEEAWRRVDISAAEASEDADWVRVCATENSGRDMRSLTTAGNLEKFATAGGGAAVSAPEVDENNGNLIWSQNAEEIEVRIKLAPEHKSKGIKLEMKSTTLKVVIPAIATTAILEERGTTEAKLAEGCELGGKIDPSESTWTLTDDPPGFKTLVITLWKKESKQWFTLLK